MGAFADDEDDDNGTDVQDMDTDKQQQLYDYLKGQQDTADSPAPNPISQGSQQQAPADMMSAMQADTLPSQSAAQSDDDSDDSDDDDSSSPGGGGAKLGLASALASPDVPPAQKQSAIQQYLSLIKGGNDQIAAAQQRAHRTNTIANIGDALETMAKANSMAHGGAGVDSSFYQGLKQQGQQGVAQAQNQRDAAIKSYLQQKQLGTQADDNDPQSAASQGAQKLFSLTHPGITGGMSGMSKAQLDSASTSADKLQDLLSTTANKKMQIAADQDKAETKSGDTSVASGEPTKGQLKAYTDLNQRIVQFRGNQQVQRAAMGVGSGKRALDLISLYPDPNQMPPDKANLLATEIAAMATGGVPTEAGAHNVAADTVASRWAQFVQKVGNEPTGAQLGAFIGQNKAYIQDMLGTNQSIVKDYQKTIYDGYKHRIGDSLDKEFHGNHPDMFPGDQAGPQQSQQQAPQQQAPKQQGVVAASTHPQAQQAADWAKDHPSDPRAKVIIQRLGAKNAAGL